MHRRFIFASLTRVSDLASEPFDVVEVPRDEWRWADYVVGEVLSPPGELTRIEHASGRLAEVYRGDMVIGALGRRYATLEAVGSWEDIGADGRMHALTSAGLMGRLTSVSLLLPPLLELEYRGHVVRDGRRVSVADFAPPIEAPPYDCPTILIIGTSMSAGKTTSAKIIIRELKAAGLRVAGTKLTGAGRYQDILAMRDAGADAIYDFMDGGLPSSICSTERFRSALSRVLGLVKLSAPDVVVVEAGASPFEPYNGDVLLEEIGEQVCCKVLAASDPYAVVGVIQGFHLEPDLVAGIATSTSAGIELVEKLTGVRALNLMEPQSLPALREVLAPVIERVRS